MPIVTEMFKTASYEALRAAVRGTSLRQKLIASNVANIDTPGYKTRDVDFSKVFKEMKGEMSIKMRKTHPMHMDGLVLDPNMDEAIFLAYKPANPNDGVNDVDLDREMVKNSETSTNFGLYSNLIRKKYEGLKNVIEATQ